MVTGLGADRSHPYAFILTIQWGIPNGSQTYTTQGTFLPQPGQTRHEAQQQILDEVCQHRGALPKHTAILFFSLESNRQLDHLTEA